MKALLVRDLTTGEVVRRIDVSQKSERGAEKVEMGLLRQMDLDRFSVDYED